MSAIDDRLAGSPQFAAARATLGASDTPAFWRSLDELAGAPAFQEFLDAEFPRFAERIRIAPDRRSVLQLMGAALAMGGLAGCKQAEKIVPYVRQPENVVPGRPLHFATSLAIDGYAFGAIVESHEGRPTKIEGNPDHPASLGASDAIMQAACLSLYDPDRSRSPRRSGEPASWGSFLAEVAGLREKLLADGGQGFAVLVGRSTSPTFADQMRKLVSAFPNARVFRHDPLAADGEELALGPVFGKHVRSRHHLEHAKIVVSLDADFLGEGPGRLADARAFSSRRILRDGAKEMCRLYAFESAPGLTGASADHRWPVRASTVEGLARAIGARLGIRSAGEAGIPAEALDAIAADLREAGPGALVIAGAHQPAPVHALAFAMNTILGAVGETVDYIPDAEFHTEDEGSLADLTAAIDAGGVNALLILDGDPVYSAPGDVALAKALSSVPLAIHHGLYVDRTARLCRWHVPATHDLESWSDLTAFDGTRSIVQPLIQPLYEGRTVHQVLAAFLGDYQADARGIVRAYWQSGGLDEEAWNAALQKGVVAGTAAAALSSAGLPAPATDLRSEPPRRADLEVRFIPDPWLRAGAYANNVWLQELPRPLTKIVWGNAALLAPTTAKRLGLSTGDIVSLHHADRKIEIAVSVEPGHAEDSLTLSLGFARRPGESSDSGVNVYPLRSIGAPWILAGVTLAKTGARGRIVTTQHHHAMEGRDIVRHASLPDYLADHGLLHGEPPAREESLYQPWDYKDEAWGMVIDQSVCIGCMACVAACQAENNIPTVGIEEVERGHEMHWLRVDRYYAGPPENPHALFQPIPCMQCEKAPCEVVCPVNATTHTHDGLNAQVYNRCIGTRYCSQNCPYKVRRFNFLEYQPFDEGPASPTAPLMNPDVTVRSRGVMEKCTYCVQRINNARIGAEIDGRPIADGEIVTACQQACPTQAIVFGDLNKAGSTVRRLRDHPLDYTLLAELNTRPRTTYLGRITNPNPRIAGSGEGQDG